MVDPRFFSMHATVFTLTKTPWHNFTVTDVDGVAVMQVESTTFLFLPRHYLLRDAASRRPVLTVKHTPSLFQIRRRWEVFRGDSTSQTDLLFVAVAQPSIFTAADVHVHLAGGDPSETNPDFVVVRCGYQGCESTVSRGGGAAVAQISRNGLFRFLGYNVSIKAGVDHAFILALTLILEGISIDDVLNRRH
jgi:uncharacterized protein YxjI